MIRCIRTLAGSLAVLGLLALPAFAAKYDPGASDKEIKIGNIMPYSGPASAYGAIGKTEAGYFKMINDQGGINGRKITFISEDDGYSPPRTVEQARKLIEQDEVLFIFGPLGTPPNSAIEKYMNMKKVPQLFVATGATKWGDYHDFPWTMGWQPTYQGEARIYAKYILSKLPHAKIAVMYQNDDYGKDYLKGFKDGLGSKTSMIVSEVSYETTDPTVENQIVTMKNSGANVFFNITTPKFAAQAIKKAAEIGWKPTQFLNNVSGSIGAVLMPAGLDASQGLISTQYLKDPDDPAWAKDKGMNDWRAFVAKYAPDANMHDANVTFGYNAAMGVVQVLKQCGDDLTRENVMKQAASLKNLELPLLLPGIKVTTTSTDYYPIEEEQLIKFEGKSWVRFGEVLSAR